MTHEFDRVLARYNQRVRDEAVVQHEMPMPTLRARRDEFLLPIGEEVGWFLRALIVARGAKTIVELGTSYGYSTLFLADAARVTGGVVHTLDIAADKQAYARTQMEHAGLCEFVAWRPGDALKSLRAIKGPIDFVLVDLWKELYVPCLEIFLPKMSDNGVIAADNMLFPAISRPEAEVYRAAVKSKPELQSMLLPIGSGIELSCVWRQT